jgi:hypothetical protein
MPFRHDNWRLIQIPLNKSSTKGSFERTSSDCKSDWIRPVADSSTDLLIPFLFQDETKSATVSSWQDLDESIQT